jgi:hypothetical protein
MIMTTITLEGKVYEVAPPAFGKLRKIIAAFNRMHQAGEESLATTDDAALVIGLLINKTTDEIDAMQISFKEMVEALGVVPVICGLEMKVSSGEALVAETDLMKSTAT